MSDGPCCHHRLTLSPGLHPVGGMRVGVGKFTKENGDVYECEWVDDLPHGFGKITYKSRARYAGELAEGHIHGKGLFVYTDGSSYEGEWVEVCAPPSP